jgi:hypothetical protein
MLTAYILVKFVPTADLTKVSHALKEPGIKEIDMALGPWDAFVRCETEDFAALGQLAQRVRSCPGIADTLTCPII